MTRIESSRGAIDGRRYLEIGVKDGNASTRSTRDEGRVDPQFACRVGVRSARATNGASTTG